MELLLVVLLAIVIAAAAFAVFHARRRRGAIGTSRLQRGTPSPRQSRRARRHPMADAVQEHARAMDPRDVVAAEHRLQAEAGRVASGLGADASRDEHARVDAQVADTDPYADPRIDGYAGPATEPRLGDPRLDARAAGNPIDPREDPRYRSAG